MVAAVPAAATATTTAVVITERWSTLVPPLTSPGSRPDQRKRPARERFSDFSKTFSIQFVKLDRSGGHFEEESLPLTGKNFPSCLEGITCGGRAKEAETAK
jgi:hypothetical protein